MNIEELAEVTPEVVDDVNSLLGQLVHDPSTLAPVSAREVQEIVDDAKTVVVVARDGGRVVGMGLLLVVTKFRGKYAYIEDMVVDGSQRGKGVGTLVMQQLIASARARGIHTIELSTRPSRVAANELYKKLGFVQKETNVYRMTL